MPSFSNVSRTRLEQCHPHLQLILNEAISYVDFSVVTGYRDKETQNSLYTQGFSKVIYPNSKHNKFPSKAVDVAPYYKQYGGALFGGPEQVKRIMRYTNKSRNEVESFIVKAYARLIGIFEGIATQNGISIRVGLDWDGDFDTLDQTFHDLGHIELL
jgi:peptidoglycan L-alanyl-D-glutamate endopeptidase CwlK